MKLVITCRVIQRSRIRRAVSLHPPPPESLSCFCMYLATKSVAKISYAYGFGDEVMRGSAGGMIMTGESRSTLEKKTVTVPL